MKTLVALAVPLAALADDGDDDVRVERRCTGTSTVRLRVRTRESDRLRVELDVRTARRAARWVVVIVHERRLVLRTTRRTSLTSRSFSVRLTIPDWPGQDTVVARAIGPRGELCRAVAVLAED